MQETRAQQALAAASDQQPVPGTSIRAHSGDVGDADKMQAVPVSLKEEPPHSDAVLLSFVWWCDMWQESWI